MNLSSWQRLPRRLRNNVKTKLKGKLTDLAWRGTDLRWRLRSGIEVEVANQAEWVIYNDIFCDGEYDAVIQRALSYSVEDTFRVLDLGANVGYFSMRFAHLLAQRSQKMPVPDFHITMVEGSPKTFAELKRRLSTQSSLRGRVEFVNGLVSERQGHDWIIESSFHVMSGLRTGDEKAARGVEMPFINLESLNSLNGPIHLLKCDIEGSELRFLENYAELLTKVRVAVFEFHREQCDTERCLSLLRAAGFQSDSSDSFDGGSYFTGVFWK